MVEYLDPSIDGESISANNWTPGVWTNAAEGSDEWQPDIEPPHINDYKAFKKHKHYGKYFRPWRYVPFPAWMHHKTLESKIVNSKEEVAALGPEWSREPFKRQTPTLVMVGKALPIETDTQRLAKVIAAGMAGNQPKNASAVDPAMIAAVVAAVLAGMQKPPEPIAAPVTEPEPEVAEPAHESIERKAMIELAEKEGIKIDKRWGDERIKKELGL